MTQIAIHGC